jgi:hypothetical protein
MKFISEITMATTLLPAEAVPGRKRTSQQHISFDIRLTRVERKALDKLSKDFAESLVLIFTKSLRLYRATVDAADQGGSLVLIKNTTRSSNRPDSGTILTTSMLTNRPDIPVSANKIKSNQSSSDIFGLTGSQKAPMAAKYSKDHQGDSPVSTLAKPTAENIANLQTDSSLNDGAKIAARDQFAPYSITPILLNPEYFATPKGPKTERVTLRANQYFISQLDELENRTGSLKSIILRDSARLYDFVKRNFSKHDTIFYIGGRPIGMI